MPRQFPLGRRRFAAAALALSGVAGAAAPATAAVQCSFGPDAQSLRSASVRLSQPQNGGDVAGFLGLFDERALVIDEDAPFPMTKSEFIDHLGFHGAGNWQGFFWVPRETRVLIVGDTRLTTGGVTFRGKPVDAGFRLRHVLHSITSIRRGADWRIVCFHQTALFAHINGASPRPAPEADHGPVYVLRGKPVDSGFRLRLGLLTSSFARRSGEWRALVANFGPRSGHIVSASPN
jgi:hypothetical protein